MIKFYNAPFLILSQLCVSAQTDFSIGSDTVGNTGSTYPCPLQDYYEGSRAQYLYSASELRAAGMWAGVITSKLDWSTFRMIDASHSYQLIISDGSRCVWAFNNIKLVDSVTNPALSNGYVTCIIKPKTNLVLGDIIRNSAAIYFDYNLPIITNA